MTEAGKDSQWASFAHPDHGYVFCYPGTDGAYAPDPVQREAFELCMGFFDRYLR
jgi:hypothetical protein